MRIICKKTLKYSGVTLSPKGIYVGKGVYVNDVDMMMHEFGHILQYREYGSLAYYDVIAPEIRNKKEADVEVSQAEVEKEIEAFMKNKKETDKEDKIKTKKSRMCSRQDSHGSYTGVPLGDADEIVQDADDL